MSRLKLIYCAIFGHEFNDHSESKEQHQGNWYLTRTVDTCSVCQLSKIDESGMFGLYELQHGKFGNGIKSARLIPTTVEALTRNKEV